MALVCVLFSTTHYYRLGWNNWDYSVSLDCLFCDISEFLFCVLGIFLVPFHLICTHAHPCPNSLC